MYDLLDKIYTDIIIQPGKIENEHKAFCDMVDRYTRKLSKRQKGSRNRHKQRLRVAVLHEKIANQRRDFLHKYPEDEEYM